MNGAPFQVAPPSSPHLQLCNSRESAVPGQVGVGRSGLTNVVDLQNHLGGWGVGALTKNIDVWTPHSRPSGWSPGIYCLILEGFLTVSQGLRTCIRGLRETHAAMEEPRTQGSVSWAEGLCGSLDKNRPVEELQSVPNGPPSSGQWEQAPEGTGRICCGLSSTSLLQAPATTS